MLRGAQNFITLKETRVKIRTCAEASKNSEKKEQKKKISRRKEPRLLGVFGGGDQEESGTQARKGRIVSCREKKGMSQKTSWQRHDAWERAHSSRVWGQKIWKKGGVLERKNVNSLGDKMSWGGCYRGNSARQFSYSGREKRYII